MVQLDMVQLDMVQLDMVQLDMVQLDMYEEDFPALLTSLMTCIPMNRIKFDTTKFVALFTSMSFSQREVPMMLYTFHHSV